MYNIFSKKLRPPQRNFWIFILSGIMTNEKIHQIALKINPFFTPGISIKNFSEEFKNVAKKAQEYFLMFNDEDFFKLFSFELSLVQKGIDTPLEVLINDFESSGLLLTFYTSFESVDRTCEECWGDGEKDCDECDGSGEIECNMCGGDGVDGDEECDSCSGSGFITCEYCSGDGDTHCDNCNGEGEVRDYDVTTITITLYYYKGKKVSNRLKKSFNDTKFPELDFMEELAPYDNRPEEFRNFQELWSDDWVVSTQDFEWGFTGDTEFGIEQPNPSSSGKLLKNIIIHNLYTLVRMYTTNLDSIFQERQ